MKSSVPIVLVGLQDLMVLQNQERLSVSFHSYKAKESILKAALRRMKPERIHIFEDLAEETMEKRRAQLPQLRQAKAQEKILYFSLDRLIIKDRPNGSGTMASYTSISG